MGKDEDDLKEAVGVIERERKRRVLERVLGFLITLGYVIIGIFLTKLTPWNIVLTPMTKYDIGFYIIIPWGIVSILLAVWKKRLRVKTE